MFNWITVCGLKPEWLNCESRKILKSGKQYLWLKAPAHFEGGPGRQLRALPGILIIL